jgi:endoglucanase
MPSGVTLGSAWNAVVTVSGTNWTAKGPEWARNLPAGQSVVIGFTANGPQGQPSGVTCSGG